MPAFTPNTTDKHGIPIIKAEYYLIVCIYLFYANTYLNIKCPALSIALPSIKYSKFLGMIISPF
jgi:hypothetical protein